MKKITFMIICVFVISSAFAQLTSRENDETTVKLGARPKAGDMALTFGMDLNNNDKDSSKRLPLFNNLATGSMLTWRYFKTDNMAYRMGVRLSKHSVVSKGDFDKTNFGGNDISFKSKEVTSNYTIMPGIEKHYLKSNFFDVYTAADLLLAYGQINKTVENSEFSVGSNTAHNNSRSVIAFEQLGLGLVIGCNVFIAQLPVSLGLEYGLSAKYTFGNKEKVKVDTDDGNGNSKSFVYYRDPSNPESGDYSKLSKHEFGMDTNQNVRIVLNVYFGK